MRTEAKGRSTPGRLTDGLLWWPVQFVESMYQAGVVVNLGARILQPMGQRLCFAKGRNPSDVPGIENLRLPIGKTTVVRSIWAVVVDAVNRQVRFPAVGSRPFVECQETSAPFLANGDPSAAVIFERRMAWICAALFDSSPNFIEGRLVETARVTPSLHSAPIAAAARGSMAREKLITDYSECFAAVAAT